MEGGLIVSPADDMRKSLCVRSADLHFPGKCGVKLRQGLGIDRHHTAGIRIQDPPPKQQRSLNVFLI